jgi:hypothetical protein
VDRRAFLESLAALGASIPAAALAKRPSRATLDGAIAGLAGTPWWVPVLHAWKDGAPAPALDALCDALEVPESTECDRADVAVARLLLGAIQDTLPSWSLHTREGLVVARPVFPTRLDGTPVFVPTYVGSINWADSGPGFSWPEAYHVTAVPELRMQVVTASRDSEDAWGCTDHALAWTSLRVPAPDAARAALRASWRRQRRLYDQDAWACAIGTGLLDEATLLAMRDAVWPRRDADDDGDGDDV